MKLIVSLTSPFARKARIVALEKQLPVELIVDPPFEKGSAVHEYNPLGKVPVLVLADGEILYDSRVIVEYLDRLTPNARLLPTDSRPLMRVKRWEALADGISDAAATIFLEQKRAVSRQDATWIARQQEKIDRGLANMAEHLADKPHCTTEGFSLADIATGCALGYLDFRFPKIKWQRSYPNLAQLYQRLQQRTSFAETKPNT